MMNENNDYIIHENINTYDQTDELPANFGSTVALRSSSKSQTDHRMNTQTLKA